MSFFIKGGCYIQYIGFSLKYSWSFIISNKFIISSYDVHNSVKYILLHANKLSEQLINVK